MYTFTSEPSSPKPFGQINFSRIRDVYLQLNTLPFSSTKQFRVIGISYNILTIKNGIAGVMFNSNDY
jgi:hypothetical protein